MLRSPNQTFFVEVSTWSEHYSQKDGLTFPSIVFCERSTVKKARQVEIVEPVSSEDFMRIRDHIANSMTWYCTNQSVNTFKLIEKMRSKGVENRPYSCVDEEGRPFRFNFVEAGLLFMHELKLLDDEYYAESVARRFLASGKGVRLLGSHLRSKGVDDVLIERLVDNHKGSNSQTYELAKVYERLLRSSTYLRKKDERSRRDYLFSSLIRRGFSFDDVREFHDSRMSIDDKEDFADD